MLHIKKKSIWLQTSQDMFKTLKIDSNFLISMFIPIFTLKADGRFLEQRSELLLLTAITASVPHAHGLRITCREPNVTLHREGLPEVVNLGVFTGPKIDPSSQRSSEVFDP